MAAAGVSAGGTTVSWGYKPYGCAGILGPVYDDSETGSVVDVVALDVLASLTF